MRNPLQGQGNQVLPKFAWIAEKTKCQAWASCSTKEHIRAMDGSVPVEEASNLHAGPCRAELAEIEVAQNALCFAACPGLVISWQRIGAHTRSSKQIPEEPEIKGLRGGVLKYAAQEIPQIDPPEAEKRAIYGWK